MSAKRLIYGLGNRSRGDDALGPLLIERIADLAGEDIVLDENFQLLIEDAEAMSHYDEVILVDAAVDGPEEFSFTEVQAEDSPPLSSFSHHVSPTEVVSLAGSLFGSAARFRLLAIRGYDFDMFHEGLSPQAEVNLQRAEEYLREYISGRAGKEEESFCEDNAQSERGAL